MEFVIHRFQDKDVIPIARRSNGAVQCIIVNKSEKIESSNGHYSYNLNDLIYDLKTTEGIIMALRGKCESLTSNEVYHSMMKYWTWNMSDNDLKRTKTHRKIQLDIKPNAHSVLLNL